MYGLLFLLFTFQFQQTFTTHRALCASAVAIVAIGFGVVQSEKKPYKMLLDNTLRVLTEQHTVIFAAVDGAILGDTSNEADECCWSFRCKRRRRRCSATLRSNGSEADEGSNATGVRFEEDWPVWRR